MEKRPSVTLSTASDQSNGSIGSTIRKFLTASFVKDEDTDDCTHSSLNEDWKHGEKFIDRLCSINSYGDHTASSSMVGVQVLAEHASSMQSENDTPESKDVSNNSILDCCVKHQSPPISPTDRLEAAKTALFASLGDESHVQPEKNPEFLCALELLESAYKRSNIDARRRMDSLDGNWLLVSRLNFPECLGKNEFGDAMYTLGRMSFDMFRPTSLKCSIQSASNIVSSVGSADGRYCRIPEAIPKSLEEEVLALLQSRSMKSLRMYNISIALTVEDLHHACVGSFSPVAVRGIMTNIGYTLPDPSVPNRLSVWFTGGVLEEEQSRKQTRYPSKAWRRIFKDPRRRDLSGKARVLAARLLMGAQVPNCIDEKDGSMEFNFTRPIGGHGKAYCDVLYLDDTLRIMRGNKGSIYVMQRK